MDELRQNELFSAYLDGELNADERAEVEKLLAGNPAARQLLEELRALSVTLQSLPQESLAEDLMPEVLRIAERRMLIGEPAGVSENAPTPWVRSIFSRFLNRRSLAWAGLATAIAVMISVNEWYQRSSSIQLAQHVGMTSSAAANNRVPRPPEVRVAAKAKDRDGAVLKYAVTPEGEAMDAFAEAEGPAAPLPPSDAPLARTETVERASGPGDVFKREIRAANEPSPSPRAAVLSDENMSFGARQLKSRLSAGELSQFRGTEDAAKGSSDRDLDKLDREVTQDAISPTDGVTVVRCDISAEGDRRHAFEKLLDANGITWREQAERTPIADETVGDKRKDGQDKKQDMSRPETPGTVNLVWVEATEAQVNAALAGLAAQPKTFLAYTVSPPSAELPEDIVDQFVDSGRPFRRSVPGGSLFQFQQRTIVSGDQAGPGTVGELEMKVNEQPSLSVANTKSLEAAEIKAAVPSQPDHGAKTASKPAKEAPPVQQRVLFVLRVVEDAIPAATAESPAKPASATPAAEPAASQNPPAEEE